MLRNRTDRNENQNIILRCKNGFTLIEAVVVLVILAIVAAIAIPTASHYIKLAEFRKNEANAKTAYLAAESMLTWYRTSGEWESFREEIIDKGTPNNTFPDGDTRNGRIYAVTLNSQRSAQVSASGGLVREFLDDLSYDEEFFQEAIAVEIDVETGLVYSAFYATRCEALSYDEASVSSTVLDISAREGNRAYDNRKGRLLGYYSAEDVANVVELKPIQLKVTSINLVNSETLSLNWSSNSRHDNMDVNFQITFYNKKDDSVLFTAQVNRKLLSGSAWNGSQENQMASLALQDKDHQDLGTWSFPLLYTNSGRTGRFSLILDAMMSASLTESLKAHAGTEAADGLVRNNSVTITRLGSVIDALKTPQDIYAVIEAEPYYAGMNGDLREYNKSLPARSNVENTLFDTAVEETAGEGTVLKAEISRFRHLSNIRYYDTEKKAQFTLTGRNIDWTAAGAGLYDAAVEENAQVRKLTWRSSLGGENPLDFPSIPLLSGNHTLRGTGTGLIPLLRVNTSLSNLHLGKESVAGDEQIEALYGDGAEGHYSRYLGLFCEAEGTIEDVTFQNPALELVGEGEQKEDEPLPKTTDLTHLYGLGILCGRNQGRLKNAAVSLTDKNAAVITVSLADRETENGERDTAPAGIGGLAGVLALKGEEEGSLKMLTASELLTSEGEALVEGLSMEGKIRAELPKPQKAPESTGGQEEVSPESLAADYSYGIGGIFGYARIGGTVRVENCENHADITGNLFTGGIGGRTDSSYYTDGSAGTNTNTASGLTSCANDGLILCAQAAAREDKEAELTGRYFGGILGYGSRVEIKESSSASGRSESYSYMKNGYSDREKEATLLGQYVGGILGYGDSSHLVGCETERGGYVLGSDYVGGIAGGLSNDIRQVITGSNELSVTTNAGYVIGNSYVGGIVGKNGGSDPDAGETVVHNCVNNGVVAGYGTCIGGIVGYNGRNGVLEDCASYLSDHDHSIYNTVVNNWKTTGDCVGGLAGYNNGKIQFSRAAAAANVKSVSSIVTGRNFVGGVIGFNDTEGGLTADYELMGGQIYGTGAGAGGAVGLNASLKFLTQALEVRPSSVTGVYGTGGVIGINIVDLKSNTEVSGLKTNNGIGSINGRAFTGGIIGYQRTYTEEQLLGLSDGTAAQDQSWPEGSLLFRQLLEETAEDFQGQALIPSLDEDSLPKAVAASENPYRLTITNSANDRDNLNNVNNNIPIRSYAYIGGIVGYCERNSLLALQNCNNSAEISRISGSGQGISLKAYLRHEGMNEAADQIEGDPQVYMIGGVIGANMENQIIDHCVNTGNMRGFQGLGGIVGFNAGGVFNCSLDNNFGNTALDYIGGIAGLNVNADAETYAYTDVYGVPWSYSSGTIGKCSTGAGRMVSGRSYVGGIAGFNLLGGTLTDNTSYASVTAAGGVAGGIAGGNAGVIRAAADDGTVSRTVTGNSGSGIGGLVGYNRPTGVISVQGTPGQEEVIAVGSQVRITGQEQVGGAIGINEGILKAEGSSGAVLYLTAQAAEVRAVSGAAGGIAGVARGTGGNIAYARNRCAIVTADRGTAGGIVAVNGAGMTLENCQNLGNVNSDSGYAGGVAAENQGTIRDCSVGKADETRVTVNINSNGVDEIGALCAVNTGVIEIKSVSPLSAKNQAELTGNAGTAGGVAGLNQGSILGTGTASIEYLPKFSMSGSRLTVGGVAGANTGNGKIQDVTVGNSNYGDKENSLSFAGFSNYQYLGGIAGRNESTISLDDSGQFSTGIIRCKLRNGYIEESKSTAGNCYGGIAGINGGALADCEVISLVMKVQGVYTASSTSTAAQKEAAAVHVGGVAGKNEENAQITRCYISGTVNNLNDFTVGSGMVGGIAGYNKGSISLSGYADTEKLMENVVNPGSGEKIGKVVDTLRRNAERNLVSKDTAYVSWGGGSELEAYRYNGGSLVSAGRELKMIMSVNGNLGGVTAYNGPTGEVDRCATGKWYLNNKSNAIGVGTGGVIGMNESEKDQTLLLNQAFVGRQLGSGAIDRFAGGIIGGQNNITAEGWKIRGCLNYGTVYCRNTHYSGGIIGQWTGTGGTIEKCSNYGNLQTTYWQADSWHGAAGGIVAELYHGYAGNEYNIVSCENYGNIYCRNGTGTRANLASAGNYACANDSAGILGNVTTYYNDNAEYTIQVLDCVNGSGVEIYSKSMASGIVGFFSADDATSGNVGNSTKNVTLHIERCRNFANRLIGGNHRGGIFGERFGQEGSGNTIIRDCYSVNYADGDYDGYPVIAYSNGANNGSDGSLNSKLNDPNGLYNYYIDGTVSFNNGTVGTPAAQRIRANTGRAYIISKGNVYYLAYLVPDRNLTISNNNLTIADDDTLRLNNQIVGKLLFKIGNHTHATMGTTIVNIGTVDNFDTHARPAYHKLEDSRNRITSGPDPVVDTMLEPQEVGLSIKGNRVTVTVTPADGTDPFKYKAKVALGGTIIRNLEFYSEEYSFELSAQEALLAGSGSLSVSVCACSMFDDVSDSAYVNREGEVVQILPAPELKIELVRDTTAADGLTYRFWLDNIEDYQDFIPGSTGNAAWKVQIIGTDVEIQPQWDAAANGGEGGWVMSSLYKDSNALSSNALQQLLVQAQGTGTNSNTLSSEQVSIPVYLPQYRPSMALSGNGALAEPSVRAAGDNLTNLSITVTLTASENAGNITTPPIYRAELTGTWNKGGADEKENVVIASTDILAAATESVSAVFNHLPEYMSWLKEDGSPYVTDLKVRIRYAQPGLGNVYTYYSIDDANRNLYTLTGGNSKENANIILLDEENTTLTTVTTGTGETTVATPGWLYMDSPVLDNTVFKNNTIAYWAELPGNGSLFTWLPAPKLADAPALKTDAGPDGDRMEYTFQWDLDDPDSVNNHYIISLTGLVTREDGSVSRVSIVTSQEQTGNTFRVDAENWTYKRVELTVTRRGTEGTEIGLTSSKVYDVKQRLPRPAQPIVTLPDLNELNYTLEWEPIEPETGCKAYEIYVRPYKDDGTPGDEVWMGEVSAGDANKDEAGSYHGELALEDYAGQKLLVYLRAQADPDDSYIQSVDGVTYELDVPSRIADPEINDNSWLKNWDYASDKPVNIADFQGEGETLGSGLVITVRPNTPPPGDSAYLVKAYVFEDEASAENAKETLKSDKNELLNGPDGTGLNGYIASYPIQTGSIFAPVSMTTVNPLEYQHTLRGLSAKYAGKWILFYVRISSGNGQISSNWLPNPVIWQLPYVKLKTPESGSSSSEREMEADIIVNPDLPDTWGKETWSAVYKTAEWKSVDLADAYDITLTPKNGVSQTLKEQQLRILETMEDTGVRTLQVFAEVPDESGSGSHWEEITGNMNEAGGYAFDLGGFYTSRAEGTYQSGGQNISYGVTASARLEADLQEDGGFVYRLILPDADSVTTEAGEVIAEESLRPTESITISANVRENDPVNGTVSDAYTGSEDSVITFGN